MLRPFVVLVTATALWGCRPATARAGPCDNLVKLAGPATTITSARVVAPGEFRLPPGRRASSTEFFNGFDSLPSFCRVQAIVAPSADSHIKVEVWLPTSGWNGRYLGVGNGGFGGSLAYFRLGEAVNSGYVGASTDTGHEGAARDSRWSIGHPEKQTDFDYRAVHEMTVLAKSAIAAFYGKPATRSYFSSCSNGGRQGLMEAERYPADYDGIMAGAPAYHFGFRTFVSGRLEEFRNRGGKVIIYHGSADNPEGSAEYFRAQVARIGADSVGRFMQLYIVPGMGHCGSGDVPNDFGQWVRPDADAGHSMLKALERWVENGTPAESVIATQWKRDGDATSGVVRTRPLCPYPREARLTGSGSKDEAANYSCAVAIERRR